MGERRRFAYFCAAATNKNGRCIHRSLQLLQEKPQSHQDIIGVRLLNTAFTSGVTAVVSAEEKSWCLGFPFLTAFSQNLCRKASKFSPGVWDPS